MKFEQLVPGKKYQMNNVAFSTAAEIAECGRNWSIIIFAENLKNVITVSFPVYYVIDEVVDIDTDETTQGYLFKTVYWQHERYFHVFKDDLKHISDYDTSDDVTKVEDLYL